MVDRKPNDEFRALKIGDSNDDDGATQQRNDAPQERAGEDEISPEDAAAIAAAMAADDDDDAGDDKDLNSVAAHQGRRDRDGGCYVESANYTLSNATSENS